MKKINLTFKATAKLAIIWGMALMMSNLPQLAAAETLPALIPTSVVVGELSRQQAEQNLQDLLSKDEVRDQLVKNGVSPDEASQRIASLSDVELKQLHTQVEQARAGGDILFTILIVVLIIFLVKRI